MENFSKAFLINYQHRSIGNHKYLHLERRWGWEGCYQKVGELKTDWRACGARRLYNTTTPFPTRCRRRRRRVQSGDHGAHRNEQPPKSYHGRRSKDQRIPTCGYQSYFAWRKIICVHFSLLQGLARMQAPGLVKFAPAVAYHFGLAFPAAYLQPGARLLAEPCRSVC